MWGEATLKSQCPKRWRTGQSKAGLGHLKDHQDMEEWLGARAGTRKYATMEISERVHQMPMSPTPQVAKPWTTFTVQEVMVSVLNRLDSTRLDEADLGGDGDIETDGSFWTTTVVTSDSPGKSVSIEVSSRTDKFQRPLGRAHMKP